MSDQFKSLNSNYDQELNDKYNEDSVDLRRVKSSAYLEGLEHNAALSQLIRNLEKQIRVLQKEVADLKTKSSRIRYRK